MFTVSPKIELPEGITQNYRDDATFWNIYRLLNEEELGEKVKEDQASRLLSYFETRKEVLYYDNKICVPKESVRDIFFAHDNRTENLFGYSKTLSRLYGFH